MAARAGVEPTTLRLRVIASTNAPPCPDSLIHHRYISPSTLLFSSAVIQQRRIFSVAGPTAWNGLPVALRLMPVAHSALFFSGLKTTLFDRGWAGSVPE